jgi:hypothetical protein
MLTMGRVTEPIGAFRLALKTTALYDGQVQMTKVPASTIGSSAAAFRLKAVAPEDLQSIVAP